MNSSHKLSSTPPPVTDAMIEAGFRVLWATEFSSLRDVPQSYKEAVERVYLAMHAARSNQEATPDGDGQ